MPWPGGSGILRLHFLTRPAFWHANHHDRLRKAPAPRHSDLIYGLDDRPHLTATVFAALQHVLASFVGIITPTLIMGSALGLQSEIPYLISMALFVSGLAPSCRRGASVRWARACCACKAPVSRSSV